MRWWSDNLLLVFFQNAGSQFFFLLKINFITNLLAAKQLLYYYPQVYDYYFPPEALKDFPQLAYLVNSTRIDNPPYFSIRSDLTSLARMPLINFAKFTYFGAGKVLFLLVSCQI